MHRVAERLRAAAAAAARAGRRRMASTAATEDGGHTHPVSVTPPRYGPSDGGRGLATRPAVARAPRTRRCRSARLHSTRSSRPWARPKPSTRWLPSRVIVHVSVRRGHDPSPARRRRRASSRSTRSYCRTSQPVSPAPAWRPTAASRSPAATRRVARAVLVHESAPLDERGRPSRHGRRAAAHVHRARGRSMPSELERLAASSPRAAGGGRRCSGRTAASRRTWARRSRRRRARRGRSRRANDPVLDEVGTVVLYLPRRLDAGRPDSLLAALHAAERLRVDRRHHRPRHEPTSPSVVSSTNWRASVSTSPRASQPAKIRPRPTHDRAGRRPSRRGAGRDATVLRSVLPRGSRPIASRSCQRVQSPYALVIHEELAAAGIPHSAPRTGATRPEHHRPIVARLCSQWPADGHRRDDLMRLLRGAPLRDPAGGRARPDRWDRVACDVGVVGGLDQWRQRLDAAREPSRRTHGHGAGRGPTSRRCHSTASADDDARRTTDQPAATAARRDRRAPSLRRSARGRHRSRRPPIVVLPEPVGTTAPAHLSREAKSAAAAWSEPEQRSCAGGLGAARRARRRSTSSTPTRVHDRFGSSVEHELSRAAGRVGRFGHGVFVGRLAEAVGADLDEVIVLGCAEGCSRRDAADDPLLPDRDRRVVGHAIRRRGNTSSRGRARRARPSWRPHDGARSRFPSPTLGSSARASRRHSFSSSARRCSASGSTPTP